MRKEIVVVDKERGVYRVTTQDERFYLKEKRDEVTGLPTFTWRPSVTWISGFYPKNLQFYKWLGSTGWDEAEAIKAAAGDKGSKVHNALENLIAGGTIKMEDKYLNKSTGQAEELSVDEYECLMSFVQWANEFKPKFIHSEIIVESEIYNYAGTVDCIAQIGDQVYIIDFKTGQSIWPEYLLQISAYKQALKEMGKKVDNVKLAFLQVGYKANRTKKDGTRTMYKFTEVEDKFPLFLNAKAIWENEHPTTRPKQSEYPLELKLKIDPQAPPTPKSTQMTTSATKNPPALVNNGKERSGSSHVLKKL